MKPNLKTLIGACALFLGTNALTAQVHCPYAVVNSSQCNNVPVTVQFICPGGLSAPAQNYVLAATGNPGDNIAAPCNCPNGTPTQVKLTIAGTTFLVNPPVVNQAIACSGTQYVNADASSGASIHP